MRGQLSLAPSLRGSSLGWALKWRPETWLLLGVLQSRLRAGLRTGLRAQGWAQGWRVGAHRDLSTYCQGTPAVPAAQPQAPQCVWGSLVIPLALLFPGWAGELPLSFSGVVLVPVPGNCLLPVLLCHRPCFWWPPPHALGEDGFLMPEHSFSVLIDSLRSG